MARQRDPQGVHRDDPGPGTDNRLLQRDHQDLGAQHLGDEEAALCGDPLGQGVVEARLVVLELGDGLGVAALLRLVLAHVDGVDEGAEAGAVLLVVHHRAHGGRVEQLLLGDLLRRVGEPGVGDRAALAGVPVAQRGAGAGLGPHALRFPVLQHLLGAELHLLAHLRGQLGLGVPHRGLDVGLGEVGELAFLQDVGQPRVVIQALLELFRGARDCNLPSHACAPFRAARISPGPSRRGRGVRGLRHRCRRRSGALAGGP